MKKIVLPLFLLVAMQNTTAAHVNPGGHKLLFNNFLCKGAHRLASMGGIAEYYKERASLNVRDLEGRTPIMWTIESCPLIVVEWMIEQGANVNATDRDGNTPLKLAAEKNRPDVVRKLLAAGAHH